MSALPPAKQLDNASATAPSPSNNNTNNPVNGQPAQTASAASTAVKQDQPSNNNNNANANNANNSPLTGSSSTANAGLQGAHAQNTVPVSNQNNQGLQHPGQQQEDQYRYAQQQQQQQQQYSYYYQQQQQQQQQPMYNSQFQSSYPSYYQSALGSTPINAATAGGATAGNAQYNQAYPDYNYQRYSYVQNYAPPHQQSQQYYNSQPSINSTPSQSNQQSNATSAQTASTSTAPTTAPTAPATTTSATSSATPIPQQTMASIPPQTYSTQPTSTVGQIQPVGSRPRVTTTMWEDEKTLCYQVDANGVSVVRRADNNMINGTKLLNVAHMTRGRRDGILKSEKIRDVVKIGSMHLKGVWIPFDRALAMAQREGIVDLLYPLFVRDIKQVIQQGSTTQPNANPQWQYPPVPQSVPGTNYQQQQPQLQSAYSAQSVPQTQSQTPTQQQQPQQQSQAQTQAQGQHQPAQKLSPYLTPTSLSNASLPQDNKSNVIGNTTNTSTGNSNAPTSSVPPQQQQQNYYNTQYPNYYPYQYATTGVSTGPQIQQQPAQTQQNGNVPMYQYQQNYGYGYLPQYGQAGSNDEQK